MLHFERQVTKTHVSEKSYLALKPTLKSSPLVMKSMPMPNGLLREKRDTAGDQYRNTIIQSKTLEQEMEDGHTESMSNITAKVRKGSENKANLNCSVKRQQLGCLIQRQEI